MDTERSDTPTAAEGRKRRGGIAQAAVAAALVLVIAGAGYVAYKQLMGLMTNPASTDSGQAAFTGRVDAERLAAATEADGVMERLGDGDKVVVYASIPGMEGHCHSEAVEILRSLVREHPEEMSLTITHVHTPAAAAAGMGCAGYRINGEGAFSYTAEDGTTRTAVFQRGEGGTWTKAELRMAVEAALAEASADDESAPESAEEARSGPDAAAPRSPSRRDTAQGEPLAQTGSAGEGSAKVP